MTDDHDHQRMSDDGGPVHEAVAAALAVRFDRMYVQAPVSEYGENAPPGREIEHH